MRISGIRSDPRLRKGLALALAVTGLIPVWSGHPTFAQPDSFPFEIPANPGDILEKMFGEDTADERAELEKISIAIADEQKFGEQLQEAAFDTLANSEIALEKQGRDVEYLQSLVSTLQPFMRNKERYKSIRVIVARSPRIDARSYPGGTLIFFEGLLDTVPNEAALVGIVGHELSHLDRGHQLLPLRRMQLLEKSLPASDPGKAQKPLDPRLIKLWARPFRPEDERAADLDGVRWSFQAGYDPREMAKVFQKNPAKQPPPDELGTLDWPSFFRSHPYNPERHAAILKESRRLQQQAPPAEPLFIGRENLKKRFSRTQESAATQ
ncbi:M48 family metallopeptidase [Schlesneria sp. DSM 10557]|uniref:M48 family metallopeptidase n=1 Tax=Schlesneria sp. DSM 10557 TaxID=3044399 RepID=UPI0035A1CA5D